MCAATPAFSQVEGGQPSQDTLYIIEEEIVYDTLYLYDSLPEPALMSKEELLQALRQNRDVGSLYYKKGALYLTGDEEIYKLSKADLRQLLSSPEFERYCKAKRDLGSSITLYTLSGCSMAVAALGAVQFTANFLGFSQAQSSDYGGQSVWRRSMGGVMLFACGSACATLFWHFADKLRLRSNKNFNGVANDFNAPLNSTSMELRAGPAPGGMGLTLSF